MENEDVVLKISRLPVAAPLEEGTSTYNQDGAIFERNKITNRKRNVIIVFLAVTLIVAIALGLILPNKPDEVASPANEQESTELVIDESSPNVTDEDLIVVKQEVDVETIKNIIEEAYVSPRALMDDPSTPQSRAIQWLTDTDEFIYPSDDSFGSKIIQRYIAVLFYYSLEGAGWENQVNALSPDLDECEWNILLPHGEPIGYLCNDEGSVNHISLWWNNLAGSLPNEVGNWTMLNSLNIIGGSISGTIPSSLAMCKDMKLLVLGHHELNGEIPDSFATMNKLSFAYFQLNNKLTGYNKLCHLLYDGVLSGLSANCNASNPVECECCTDCCDTSLTVKEKCCFTKYKEEKGYGTEGYCYDPNPPWLE